jgi:hypothetical protein
MQRLATEVIEPPGDLAKNTGPTRVLQAVPDLSGTVEGLIDHDPAVYDKESPERRSTLYILAPCLEREDEHGDVDDGSFPCARGEAKNGRPTALSCHLPGEA